MLLISGGALDPSIERLVRAAKNRPCDLLTCLFDMVRVPALAWHPHEDELLLDGRPVRPAAVFLRHDVFNALSCESEPAKQALCAQQAGGWQAVWRGWLLTHPGVRLLNRRFLGRVFSKPQQLVLAKRAGLRVPTTVITNDLQVLRSRASSDECIVKPIDGGQFTMLLSDALADCPESMPASLMPAIAQKRLTGAEYRIFLIGHSALAFRIESPLLDYRADQSSVRVSPVDMEDNMVGAVLPALRTLAHELGLDFCAADFKVDPWDNNLVFLEVNEQPMYAHFDQVSDGELCERLLDALVGMAEVTTDSSWHGCN